MAVEMQSSSSLIRQKQKAEKFTADEQCIYKVEVGPTL